MKYYVILHEDTHADPCVAIRTDKEKAIEEARTIAKDYARHDNDYTELDLTKSDYGNWVFQAVYSCENDGLTVIEVDVDGEFSD